jgi:ABC-type glutathione transport system ATPase component
MHRQTQLVGARGRPLPRGRQIFRECFRLGVDRFARRIQQAVRLSALLEVRELKAHFPVKHRLFSRVRPHVKAVDDASFQNAPGETPGLVGESGCCKTTPGVAIVRLVAPTAGSVLIEGEDLARRTGAVLRPGQRLEGRLARTAL